MIQSISETLIQELKAHNNDLIIQNKELKLAKSKVEIAAQRLNLFYELSPIGNYLINGEGKIISANTSGLALLGKSINKINNLNFISFISEKQIPDFKLFLLKIKNTNTANYCSIELVINKDKYLFIHLTATFLKDQKQYVLTAIDQTENWKIKKHLLENDSVFKEIQRIGHIGSYQFNISSNSLELSQELRSIFGYHGKIPPMIIETWLDIVHPDDKKTIGLYLKECIINRTSFQKEYRILRKNDGETRWVDGWGEIIFDDQKKEFSLIGVIQDITDRKLAQEKIKNAETRSHQIFESSKEGILILDAITGKITDANPFLIELIGFDYDELVGKELWEIGVFKNIATSKEAFIELQNKEYIRFEDMPLETKDGNSIDVEFVSNVYMIDAHKVILCHIRDISARKKAEKALQESGQLYYSMFEKNQTPQLLIHPVNGNIIDVNSAASKFYGYSSAEFKLMKLSDISTFPSEQIVEQMKKFTSTGPSYFEFIHKLASGETCDIEMYTSPLSISGQVLLISTINDISKRKLEEDRLLQLNIKLNEVNALKSQFISTVSHEFRTPLAGILSSVQLLEIYNDSWEKKKKEKLFKQIFDAIQHTKALLDDVSLIDEEQTSKFFFRPKNIDLFSLINEIIEENLSVIGTNQKAILKSNLQSESYFMDSIMIRHILNNIISNAFKYSHEDITINLFQIKNDRIHFIIEDNGIGIPKNEIKYLLDPFYRASNKGQVKGTGFGLTIVKRFVDLHNGEMLIESIVDKGTKVSITLPYLPQ